MKNLFSAFGFICMVFILSCSPSAAEAQSEEEELTLELVNQWVDECIQEDGSNLGVSNCYREAVGKYDQLLNKYYKRIAKYSEGEEKEAFKTSQLAWIKHRDNEIKFMNQYYGNMEGSMFIQIMAKREMDITKQRVIDLRRYLEISSGGDYEG